MKITILGTGAWGSALSLLLAKNGHQITLWSALRWQLEEIRNTHKINSVIKGILFPENFIIEDDIHIATKDADVVVVAIASQYFRQSTETIETFKGPVISVTKGIEFESGLTMSGILKETIPNCIPVALSGPSLAGEVIQGIPTAVVAASHSPEHALLAQELFHSPVFRVYTGNDIIGVELGGALKNIIAIGAGICDGMGFGANSKAALLTRAIVEIRRLGVALGARPETFVGLSGLGDLMVTCFSPLSRNRYVGEHLGRGEKIKDILAGMNAVAEGVPTAASAKRLIQKHQIDAPIISEIYSILHENKDIKESITHLIGRTQKSEQMDTFSI